MNTDHKIIYTDARRLESLKNESIELTVTSPPYPMVAMWDDLFSQFDSEIASLLNADAGQGALPEDAFEAMHRQLDAVWAELHRVTVPGGIACINIGDAVRSFDGQFRLFSNHQRIIQELIRIGFTLLPEIIWRKPSNSPTKFLGSGMLPVNAYMTLEHEFIIIARKGGGRKFSQKEAELRKRSAFFWEERNLWFSDLWELKGEKQQLARAHRKEQTSKLRERSAAFPFELPWRLIHMFSCQEDTVLDPFGGTGTTTLAAIAAGRNSVLVEQDQGFRDLITSRILESQDFCRQQAKIRMDFHTKQFHEMNQKKDRSYYMNELTKTPVRTRQEKTLMIPIINLIDAIESDRFKAEYSFLEGNTNV